MIKIYQKIFSPDHGILKEAFPFGFCRFRPTCSEYTYQSIEQFGLFKGIILGFWRILRCNPFSRGGFDPVPSQPPRNYLIYGSIALTVYLIIITGCLIIIFKRIFL